MSKRFVSLLPALLLATSASVCYAEIVTYQVNATIVSISDPNNVLQGSMNIGNTIAGTYSFDNSVPDNDPSIQYSFYDFTNSTATGFDLSVNGESLKTDPTVPGFMHQIYIGDSIPDMFHIGSWGNRPLSNGAQVHDINLDLNDNTGTALSSANLSSTPPNPSAFTMRDLYIGGTDATNGAYYSVVAQVDSITTSNSTPANPDLVTMLVDATVREVWDPANALNGAITAAATVSGNYTYNITTPDEDPSADFGHYSHKPNSGSFGFDITIGGLNFKTDTSQVEMMVDLYNGVPSPDTYNVFSYGNNFPLSTGASVQDIGMYLHDELGTMFNSGDIATNPPSINSNGFYDLYIYGMHPNGIDYYNIILTVTALTPSTATPTGLVTLSPPAGLFDKHQRFDLALIFAPDLAPIGPVNVFINGIDYSPSLFNCTIGAPNSQNRQSLVCPDFSSVLNNGTNVADFSIKLMDGTQINESVTWDVLGF